MLRIGLTGNSGAGKTIISKIIADKGIPVYDVDARCRWLTENDRGLRGAIVDLFGIRSYLNNGKYNADYMRNIVFNDPKQKTVLEGQVGHYMMKDYEQWVEDRNKENHLFLLVDCAYFYELEIEFMVDIMIGIKAPLHVRRDRIVKRDGITLEQAMLRMKNQWKQSLKMNKCDFVFDAGSKLINPKKLNDLLYKIQVFCIRYNSMYNRMKKLVATGIAYGVGVGESRHEYTNIPLKNGGFYLEQSPAKPDIEQVTGVIKEFFEDNCIL